MDQSSNELSGYSPEKKESEIRGINDPQATEARFRNASTTPKSPT